MKFFLVVALAVVFGLAVLRAQTPAPSPQLGLATDSVPAASPLPSPDLGPLPSPLPSPFASPSPFPSPVALPEPSLAPMPPLPGEPPPALVTPLPPLPAPLQTQEIPANFSEPGPPPPMKQETYSATSPDPKAVAKYNAEVMQKIVQFTAKQHNPNVPDMTLDDAIKTGLRLNPDILNAIQQIRITRGQVIEIAAQGLPQLSLTSAYNQEQAALADPDRGQKSGGTISIPVQGLEKPVVLKLPGGSQFTQDKTWNVQFQVSQLLFDGGATISGIRAAKFVEDSAYFSLRQIIDGVISSVKTQFYQVVLNRALIVAQQQSVDLLQQQLQDQVNRYEAGTVPRFNVLQAEVALANAKPPLIQAQNNLRIAQYQLVKLLGMDYKTSRPSEVPFNVVGNLQYRPRAINTDESIRTAIERSPTLKAQRQNILAQAENVRVAFAGYLPQINFNSGYLWKNDLAERSLAETNEGWFIGFTGNWAIFDGGATTGRVIQARAQLEQSSINYNNTVRQVILDVQNAISNLQTAKETIESQEASVVQAAEALRLARERLDAGAGTQLDVLNAQVALLQAQTTVLQARYDYISATAAYEKALSLDAQYEEAFDDPLTPKERKRFGKATQPTAKQPPLPPKFQATDPIVGLAPNAPDYRAKKKPAPKPKTKPAPSPQRVPAK